MRRLSTDDFLTLGMALTADKAAMEQRVRGVFARKSSARTAKILAFTLCIALGVGCFTTACRPAETATAQPSSIPLETEEQAASAETTDITSSMQKNEREDISFLSGLTEAEQLSGPFPARIERAAVAIDNYKTLKFDADVIIPETNGYGIARLEPHVFSDEEYKAFMDYLEPGGDWRTDTIDGKSFSIEATESERSFWAVIQESSGYMILFWATRGGRTIYYSKYDNVMPQSGFNYDLYESVEAADFDGAWPLEAADAQSTAEQMISDLGIVNMVPVGLEKAVSYDNEADGMAEMTSQTRGWMFYFAHEFNGLNFGNMNCVLTTGNSIYDPLDYQMLMWERLSVYVDETGVAQIDWQDALDVTETVLHNVAVVSPEEIADRLTERLQVIYDHGGNTTEATFRVTAIRLGAAAIGEFPLPEPIMSANQGLMVPCWEVETVISGGGSRHTAVYVFNAVDGGTLVGKDYEGWPDS
jgi:hypothetical protein